MPRKRHAVEGLFRRRKGFRRVFSRFDRLYVMSTGFLHAGLIGEAHRVCQQALIRAGSDARGRLARARKSSLPVVSAGRGRAGKQSVPGWGQSISRDPRPAICYASRVHLSRPVLSRHRFIAQSPPS